MSKKKKRALLIYALVNAALLLAAVLFLILDSYDLLDGFFSCPWLLFGIYCPTCGMTRAAHSLLRLQIGAAAAFNPMVFPLVALCAYYEVALLRYANRVEKDPPTVRLWPFVLFVVGLVAFAVLRNLLLLKGIDPTGDLLGG